MKQKKNGGNSIADLCIYYILIRCTWIFLSTLPIINVMIMYISGVMLVLLTIRKHFTPTLLIISLVLVAETAMISYYDGDRTEYMNVIVNTVQLIVFYFLYYYIEDSYADKAKIVWIAMIGYVITTIVSIYVVTINPNAMRTTASGEDLFKFVLGYSDYGYVYGMIIVNIVFLSYVYSYKKAITLTVVILNSILISLSGYSTAFILNMVFIMLCIVFKIRRRIIQAAMIALLAMCVLSSSWLSDGFYTLSKIDTLPEIVKSRMEQIGDTITGKGEADYISKKGERADRMTWDIDLIKQHPVVGNMMTNETAKYGMHTEWLTKMAQFGIPVGILLIMFFVKFYSVLKMRFKKKGYRLNGLNLVFLYFIVLGFVNPCTYQNTTFPLFAIVPFINEYARERKK